MSTTEDKHTVLIVEDEAIIAMDLRRQLEAHGYGIAGIVGKATDVLAAVQRHRPSVVLMDVRLQGTVDGVTLAEEIFVCEDTPAVFLSAFSDEDIVQRAARSGAYGYLTKPVTTAALTSTLEMAIQKHQDLRARRGDAQWLASAFNALNVAVVVLHPRGEVRFMNQAAVTLTGWMLMEARDTVPAWAAQLHGLQSGRQQALTLRGRLADPIAVLVQKLPMENIGSVCMIQRK